MGKVEVNNSSISVHLTLTEQELYLLLGGRLVDVFDNGFRSITVKIQKEVNKDGKAK